MVQQFGAPQKTRMSVILFLKGSATPLVMYFDNPQAVYSELKQLMKKMMMFLQVLVANYQMLKYIKSILVQH